MLRKHIFLWYISPACARVACVVSTIAIAIVNVVSVIKIDVTYEVVKATWVCDADKYRGTG